MKIQTLKCDIQDKKHSGKVETITLDVIFDHDQEDGKSKMEPYFDEVTIEICESCRKYMMEKRRYIYAYGVMGYNKYYLNN
jgi:hypothetical protein